MKYFNFRVDVLTPPEDELKFNEMINEKKREGGMSYDHLFEETAPPLELVKDIVIITANTLIILKTLYEFQKIIKNKGGKVYLTIDGEKLDLEAHNIDEIKIKMGEPSIKRYKINLSYPYLTKEEIEKWAITLSSRPILFKGRRLSENNHVLFADYDQNHEIKATIQINDKEVNELYEKGASIYATSEPKKRFEGTSREQILFLELILGLDPFPFGGILEEEVI